VSRFLEKKEEQDAGKGEGRNTLLFRTPVKLRHSEFIRGREGGRRGRG